MPELEINYLLFTVYPSRILLRFRIQRQFDCGSESVSYISTYTVQV